MYVMPHDTMHVTFLLLIYLELLICLNNPANQRFNNWKLSNSKDFKNYSSQFNIYKEKIYNLKANYIILRKC